MLQITGQIYLDIPLHDYYASLMWHRNDMKSVVSIWYQFDDANMFKWNLYNMWNISPSFVKSIFLKYDFGQLSLYHSWDQN